MSLRRLFPAALLALSALTATGDDHPWYQSDFPPEEFHARWNRVFEKIGDKAVAVVAGAPQTNGFIFPRQTNEFYYLCGVETPGSYIFLDGRSRRTTVSCDSPERAANPADGGCCGPPPAAMEWV